MALDPVIAQAIFQQQTPDLVGSFEKGREMKRSAAARDKAALSEQMQGELLQSQFSPGSQISKLAGVDPKAAAFFAKELGFGLNEFDRMKRFGLDIQRINQNTIEGNPRKTIEELVKLKAQINLVRPSPNLDGLLASMQSDPDTALGQLNSTVVGMENSNIIPQSIASKVAAEREKTKFETDEAIRKAKALHESGVSLKPGWVKGQTILTTVDGKPTFATNIVNTTTKEQETITSVIPGTLVSKLGETTGDITKRVVDEAGGKAGAAEAARIEEQRKGAGTAEATKLAEVAAQKQAQKAFEKIGSINTSMNNFDKAIDAIDKGAKTGALTSRFPSFTAASKNLEAVQNLMGLDVLANTTFGALSESELKFALSTALPTGLDELELRKWLVDKKAASQKLSDYLKKSADFLATPGNTVQGWFRLQEEGAEVEEGTVTTETPAGTSKFSVKSVRVK